MDPLKHTTRTALSENKAKEGNRYVDIFDNDIYLISAELIDGQWSAPINIGIGTNNLIAKYSSTPSRPWSVSRSLYEDFETTPLILIPLGSEVTLNHFKILNLKSTGVGVYQTGIKTEVDPTSPNHVLGVSGTIKITLNVPDAKSFECTVRQTQRLNTFIFYDDLGQLIDTFTPALPYDPTRFEPTIRSPYSAVEVITVKLGGTVWDYIEMDDITIGY
uniref:Uncharacterized protein n=1 Tax=Pseudomonas graminis TaxID=158627 RepID=A0A7C2AWM1_9PSED